MMKYIRALKKSNKASKTTQISVIQKLYPPTPTENPQVLNILAKQREKCLSKQASTCKNKTIQGMMNNNMTTYYLHNEGNIFAKGSVLVQFRKIVGEEKGILSTCVSDSYLIMYIYWDYKNFPF